MRIGLVAAGGFDRSGRERVTPALLALVEALAARNEVHVFALDYYPEPCTYQLRGATIHDVGRPGGFRGIRRLDIARRLERALNATGPFDVLHAYHAMPAGWAATHVSKKAGIPVVVTLDSGEFVRADDIEYGLQRRLVDRWAVRQTLARAGALTVSTDFMRALADRHGTHPMILPIGIDVAAFPPGERVDGPPWRLLRVATINRVKDYRTLLQAFSVLRRSVDQVHLDIVGEDILGGAMQAMTRQLGIDASVTFHGSLPSNEVARMYSKAHLNIVSSRHEASCVSVLEAACTGLATVGTAVGYVSDWAPAMAVAVPTKNAAALSEAIAGLLANGKRRHDIAIRAREWTVAHDVNWTARQLERLYQELSTRPR
jgi:glycosyltransferase involved in cell wall biosynthesis